MADFALGEKKIGSKSNVLPSVATVDVAALQRELAQWLQNPPDLTKAWFLEVANRGPDPGPSSTESALDTLGGIMSRPESYDLRIRDVLEEYQPDLASLRRPAEFPDFPGTSSIAYVPPQSLDQVFKALMNGPNPFPVGPDQK